MLWKVEDNPCATLKIVIDGDLVFLRKVLIEQKIECQCDIKLCDPYFWLTQDQRNKLTGAIGYGGPFCHDKKIASDSDVVINIKFETSDDLVDKIVQIPFELTRNKVDKPLKLWDICGNTRSVRNKYGVYKRQGFDEAFFAMKKLKPNLTENQFATEKYDEFINDDYNNICYDTDLVDIRLYDNDTNIVETIFKTDYIVTGTSTVNLSILKTDLQTNLHRILTLLMICCNKSNDN